ncbi:hypothetical protein ABKN59_005716 [Abortiporus biennis]
MSSQIFAIVTNKFECSCRLHLYEHHKSNRILMGSAIPMNTFYKVPSYQSQYLHPTATIHARSFSPSMERSRNERTCSILAARLNQQL